MTIKADPAAVPESPVTLADYSKMTMPERRKIWLDISDISEQELDEHMTQEKAREARVPQPGQMAPDFVADVLDRDKKRTGAQVRLSDLRGRPVGIVFGSFT